MSVSTSIGNVILLREPTNGAVDRYETAFTDAGYFAMSLPVLETLHTNISDLGNIISLGPSSQSITGVLITSKRSCDAWQQALQMLQDQGKGNVENWESVPFYVVGNATAMALKETLSTYAHLGIGQPEIRGQTTGSAANLAPLILDDLKKRPAKLLYLTGDKNRDTLPRLLEEGAISLQLLQVYETRGSPSFSDALSAAISSAPVNKLWWIVYFAPSAAAFVTPTLRKYFRFEESLPALSSSDLAKAKVAAIGPTTNSFLRDEMHIHVHAMAQKPTPEDIVSTIVLNDGTDL